MNNGFCILAENNYKTDYVRQAYGLACSIHKNNKSQNVSLITDDEVPNEYKDVFDKIIPIPWGNLAVNSDWKIENRWKVYHLTPYENTIVMDADMLILEDISDWWYKCSEHSIAFTTDVVTYRKDVVSTNYYRKTFVANNLPNLYSGLYYFKKSDIAKEFFLLVEIISKDWQIFYKQFAPKKKQNWQSFDLNCAIAYKLLNLPNLTTPLTFTHMKPHAQHWENIPEKWTDYLDVYLDDHIYLGNFTQKGVLHYVEDEFLTDELLEHFK